MVSMVLNRRQAIGQSVCKCLMFNHSKRWTVKNEIVEYQLLNNMILTTNIIIIY